MRFLLLVFLALPTFAQDRAWKLSVTSVAVSATLDAQSSWGGYEMNPIVGRGQFGARQAATSLSITAGVIALEYLVLRKHPQHKRLLTWTNFAIAGVRTGTAIRNYRLPGGPQ